MARLLRKPANDNFGLTLRRELPRIPPPSHHLVVRGVVEVLLRELDPMSAAPTEVLALVGSSVSVAVPQGQHTPRTARARPKRGEHVAVGGHREVPHRTGVGCEHRGAEGFGKPQAAIVVVAGVGLPRCRYEDENEE